jgi:hypothetical protein
MVVGTDSTTSQGWNADLAQCDRSISNGSGITSNQYLYTGAFETGRVWITFVWSTPSPSPNSVYQLSHGSPFNLIVNVQGTSSALDGSYTSDAPGAPGTTLQTGSFDYTAGGAFSFTVLAGSQLLDSTTGKLLTLQGSMQGSFTP